MIHRQENRTASTRLVLACLLLVLALALPSCSFMFPHTELAIQPEGATLDELGLALIADVERLVDSLLFFFGLTGL